MMQSVSQLSMKQSDHGVPLQCFHPIPVPLGLEGQGGDMKRTRIINLIYDTEIFLVGGYGAWITDPLHD